MRVGHCLTGGSVTDGDRKFRILVYGLSILALDGQGNLLVRLQNNILGRKAVHLCSQFHCLTIAGHDIFVAHKEQPIGERNIAVGENHHTIDTLGQAVGGKGYLFLFFL